MSFWAILLSVSIFLIACISLNLRRRSHPLPPGPPSWPIFGVALDHPKTEFWKTYATWGRKFGAEGLISFHILGRRLIVLNSAADAFNLFSKRSSIYSDRPFATMAGRLMRREKSIFCISYNERLKAYRKLMHQSFNPTVSQMFWEMEEKEAAILVDSIITSPENLVEHLRRNAAAVIMKIAYGYPVTTNDDHFVRLAEEGIKIASMASPPGKWLVDSFPFLRFLPEWFPGAGFKTQARQWGRALYEQSLEPHEWVKAQIRAGTAIPSFTSTLLQPSDGHLVDAEEEDKILWTSGALYFAGADTSVSVVKSFFFAMMMHPVVQRQAQEEADRFFASENRLPTLHDQAAFPYIACILKEVLRWAPASPFGLFHCTAKLDVYKGFLIPAKTAVMANIWAIMHDEAFYPDPFSFDPTRFLGDDPQPDPRDFAFGFGRRICPGQHLAEHSIWIQMVLSLLTMTISKAVDADGKIIEPEVAFTSGVVSHVKPFKYQITPRPTAALALVRESIQSSN
ncbi:O-methylsterigmatocystin oxidoreductase [Mycena sanguinolenta]|uniref:O-methylsterigmatocystin oxidoreductase n=1 Tax=Mycena sanguinolenta TaxID=230812 RepID=A0A8H6YLG8_9AGAR|nr:O-methylsterigmatocystin oxidoreductase [Mycena sanguinolenta]